MKKLILNLLAMATIPTSVLPAHASNIFAATRKACEKYLDLAFPGTRDRTLGLAFPAQLKKACEQGDDFPLFPECIVKTSLRERDFGRPISLPVATTLCRSTADFRYHACLLNAPKNEFTFGPLKKERMDLCDRAVQWENSVGATRLVKENSYTLPQLIQAGFAAGEIEEVFGPGAVFKFYCETAPSEGLSQFMLISAGDNFSNCKESADFILSNTSLGYNIINGPIRKFDTLLPIVSFTNLERIGFTNTGIRSLEPLGKLLKLSHVDIENTLVSNLAPLDDLPIKYINLKGTLVTELFALEHAAPNVEIHTLGSLVSAEEIRRFLSVRKDAVVNPESNQLDPAQAKAN